MAQIIPILKKYARIGLIEKIWLFVVGNPEPDYYRMSIPRPIKENWSKWNNEKIEKLEYSVLYYKSGNAGFIQELPQFGLEYCTFYSSFPLSRMYLMMSVNIMAAI